MTKKTTQSKNPSQTHSGPAPDSVLSLDEILKKKPKEFGGPSGPEPTRYGDWERKGRCIDF